MLSRPVRGTVAALQSTITKVSNIMRVVMVDGLVVTGADAAHMMMMPGLRRARLIFVADDLRAVLAELAIHRRLAVVELGDAVDESVEHPVDGRADSAP